jgi:hypothetical protein
MSRTSADSAPTDSTAADRFLVLALGGYSESGKSSAGRHLETRGFARLKIAALYRAVHARACADDHFIEWSRRVDRECPEWIVEQVSIELRRALEHLGTRRCSIESLYGDVLANGLRGTFGDGFQVLFLDVPQDVRIVRQQQREGFATLDEAARFIRPRDEMKREWGTDRVREIADHIVDNRGSLADLHVCLDAIVDGFTR